MIAEIASLITSSKAAYDIAKGISSFKSEVERTESISKILEVLVSVQLQASSVLALEIEKHALTKRLMELEKWSQTESQYELKEIARGIFVYAYKQTAEKSEPAHWLCTNCWQDKTKSILQRTESVAYIRALNVNRLLNPTWIHILILRNKDNMLNLLITRHCSERGRTFL
jgi:hypothetical protein